MKGERKKEIKWFSTIVFAWIVCECERERKNVCVCLLEMIWFFLLLHLPYRMVSLSASYFLLPVAWTNQVSNAHTHTHSWQLPRFSPSFLPPWCVQHQTIIINIKICAICYTMCGCAGEGACASSYMCIVYMHSYTFVHGL